MSEAMQAYAYQNATETWNTMSVRELVREYAYLVSPGQTARLGGAERLNHLRTYLCRNRGLSMVSIDRMIRELESVPE